MFNEDQCNQLAAKLNPENVKSRSKGGTTLSYVEAWHVIAEANRIFGFDGWTRELVSLIENTQPTQNAKENWIVSFRATVRITAGGVTREGTGFGSGIAKDIHDAYEGAIKEAETDAMKRGLMTFGNPFGLALYDKSQSNVGIDKPELNKERKWLSDAIQTIEKFTILKEINDWVVANPVPKELSTEQLNWFNDQVNQAQDKIAPVKSKLNTNYLEA